MSTVQAALTGALLGGLYAMMAVGLSVSWGMLRVINLAHFGMILLGAYLTFDPEVNNFWDTNVGIKQIQDGDWVMVWPSERAAADVRPPAEQS